MSRHTQVAALPAAASCAFALKTYGLPLLTFFRCGRYLLLQSKGVFLYMQRGFAHQRAGVLLEAFHLWHTLRIDGVAHAAGAEIAHRLGADALIGRVQVGKHVLKVDGARRLPALFSGSAHAYFLLIYSASS